MTMGRDGPIHRALVVYYGLVQAAHLAALAWEGFNYARTSRLILLAPPPPGGWSAGQLSLLLLLGALDSILILISLGFVYGMLVRTPWRHRLGVAVLSAFSLTALTFGIVTWPTGVWSQHPAYLVEGALFLPIGLLLILHHRWFWICSGVEADPRA